MFFHLISIQKISSQLKMTQNELYYAVKVERAKDPQRLIVLRNYLTQRVRDKGYQSNIPIKNGELVLPIGIGKEFIEGCIADFKARDNKRGGSRMNLELIAYS